MKKEYGIKMVPADKLRPHPKNPRKDLGDLSELTESIRTNGIMQNLTAVPDPENEDGYLIIIGHRRFAAGKAAGLEEFPVTVREIDEATQVKLMLCENIQRSDLTVVEQAAGFQMMMDFRITVEELSQETGFAPSTIYHRLNIAKLDQETLTKKMEQLTLKDLIELEKIEDVKKRNELLKQSGSGEDLRRNAKWAYKTQEQKKIADKIRKMLKGTDLIEKKASQWDSKVDECEHLYINEGTTVDEVKLEKKVGRKVVKFTHWWINDNQNVLTYTLTKDKKEKPTKAQLRKKEIEKLIAEQYDVINDEAHAVWEDVRIFIENMGKVDTETKDMFIAETFMYLMIEKPYLSYLTKFSASKLDVADEYSRGYSNPNKHAEFAADMRAALLEKIENRPEIWAAEILSELLLAEVERITQGCSEYYWTHDDILKRDAAYRINMIAAIFGYIGFKLDKETKDLLQGKGEPFDKIKELAEEYSKI